MSKIYIPSRGPEDWKQFLAEPEKQWKKRDSARALAYCREEADGFRGCVKRVLNGSGFPLFKDMKLLYAFPEHQVPLPGGSRPSQTDPFVLAKSSSNELVSIALKGKVGGPFGPSVGEWINNSSTGKERRLAFLCEQLGLESETIKGIRYQLLHRTVSAILKALELNAHPPSCSFTLSVRSMPGSMTTRHSSGCSARKARQTASTTSVLGKG